MNETGEAYAWDMTRGAKDSLKIPNCLGPRPVNRFLCLPGYDYSRFGIDLVQKSPAIMTMKNTRESPWLLLQGLNILDLNPQNITRLCRLDIKWPREIVDLGQVYVLDIIGGVVILDLASGPVHTFDFHDFIVGNSASTGDYST